MTTYVWQASVLDAQGNVVPGATVEVRIAATNVLATLYSDDIGTPLSNPTATDSDGFVRFYAEGGFYNITAEADAFSVREWENVLIGTPADSSFANVQNVTLTSGENLDIALSANAKVIRLTPNAAGSTLCSIDSTGNARRNVVLVNVGTVDAQTITLPHLSGSGQAGNLFSNPGGADFVLPYGDSMAIWCDDADTDNVWRKV